LSSGLERDTYFKKSILWEAIRKSFEDRIVVPNEPNTVWVTEVCGCLRRAWLRRKNAQAYVVSLDIIEGQAIHEFLRKSLESMGFEVEKKVEIILDTLKIVGKADLWDPKNRHVLELKYTGNVIKKPLFQHLMQVGFYAKVLQAKDAYVAYIIKSRPISIKLFKVRDINKMFRTVVYRARQLLDYVKKDEPPPKDNFATCNTCEYWRECRKYYRINKVLKTK